MQKIGFFGGCFNPPTYAHLYFANQAIKELKLDKVIFVPVSDFYDKPELIDIEKRIEMLNLICEKDNKLEVSSIEKNENKKLYAIDIFEIIQEKYIDSEIFFMMGSDNFKKISTWKNAENLISNYKYIICERNLDNVYKEISKDNKLYKYKDNFKIIKNNEYYNISSKEIRNIVRNNEDIVKYVPLEIVEYIKKNKLYL